jgi:hypothetical protein
MAIDTFRGIEVPAAIGGCGIDNLLIVGADGIAAGSLGRGHGRGRLGHHACSSDQGYYSNSNHNVFQFRSNCKTIA